VAQDGGFAVLQQLPSCSTEHKKLQKYFTCFRYNVAYTTAIATAIITANTTVAL
jgi:hypothetical protein